MSGLSLVVVLGSTAWLSATFGPVALAVGSWRLANQVRFGWLVHTLFLPSALALVWVGIEVTLLAAGDTGDEPVVGLLMIPAAMFLVATVFAYYAALLIDFTRAAISRPKPR